MGTVLTSSCDKYLDRSPLSNITPGDSMNTEADGYGLCGSQEMEVPGPSEVQSTDPRGNQAMGTDGESGSYVKERAS